MLKALSYVGAQGLEHHFAPGNGFNCILYICQGKIAAGLVTVKSKVAEKLFQKPLAKPLAERLSKRLHSADKILMAKRTEAYSWFWNWFLNFTQVL